MTSPIRVLVVDDLANVREELEAILQLTDGIEVVGTAADGLGAIRLAAELKPDIVLMDVEMPGLDGFESARQIKSRMLAIGIIFLSIHNRREYLLETDEANVDAYVEKGEGVEMLIETIRRVWSKHLTVTPAQTEAAC